MGREKILKLYEQFEDNEYSKIFKTTDFAYRQITIERPLRLSFQVSDERIEKLKLEKSFSRLDPEEQKNILAKLEKFPDKKLFLDREEFLKAFDVYFDSLKISAQIKKIIINSLSERDEKARICKDSSGNPESDSELRDYENVPFGTDVYKYFEKEVKPYVSDAWIDESVRDHKDNQVGKVGYEISFTRYFYKYEAPRSLEAIEADIEKIENELLILLKQL